MLGFLGPLLGKLTGGIFGAFTGAGKAAEGAAEGRYKGNEQLLEQDRNRIEKYKTEQSGLLDRYTGEERGLIDRGELGLGADRNMLDAYSTRQRAQLDALLGQERGAIDRGQLDVSRGQLGVNQADIDLKRRQFGLDAHGQLTDQALRADRLANAQPLVITHPRANIPGMTGGYTPSAELRGGMKEALTDRLGRLKAGEQFDPFAPLAPMPPPTDFQSGLLPPPEMGFQMPGNLDWGGSLIAPPVDPAMVQPSGWEKTGGILGTIGGIGMGFLGGQQPKQQPITGATPWPPYAGMPTPPTSGYRS